MSTELIQSTYSHYIIIGCSVAGLAWGGVNAMFVSDYFTRLSICESRRYYFPRDSSFSIAN